MAEPLGEYLERFDDVRARMAQLLAATDDLARLRELAGAVVLDEDLLEAARYLAGPPVSTDDLRVLAESSLTGRSRQTDPGAALRAIDIILAGLDRYRFPWLAERRPPTDAERQAAVLASGAMIAARRVMTGRANESKSVQEDQVAQRLEQAGLRRVAGRYMTSPDRWPAVGEFTAQESLVGTRKADITVRLLDGRLMPIECKVSNSSTNSIKRLNNDATAKASTWIDELGHRLVVPAAVLTGVFKVRNLEQAQERGLTIFWAHDLDRLVEFVAATGP